jgi:hypothetical protein
MKVSDAGRKRGLRRRGILWDYNLDGVSDHERIKGFWKRYWRKWNMRRLRAEDGVEV